MRRFDLYKIKRADNLSAADLWNKRFEDIDLRIHAREQSDTAIDRAIGDLAGVALQRLDNTLTPLVFQAETLVQNAEAGVANVEDALERAQELVSAIAGVRTARFSFTGDGVQTEFDLDHAISDVGQILWFEDGIWQQPGEHFTVSVEGVVTRTTAPANGAQIYGVVVLGAKGDRGADFGIDASGTFAGRSAHDDADPDFSYLSTDGDGDTITTAVVFIKTVDGWSDAYPFQGPIGPVGTIGPFGWTPLFALIEDGDRVVLQVADWTGGTIAKPATGQYVSAEGLVSDIEDAIDLRGPQGLPGANGTNGVDGADGADGIFSAIASQAEAEAGTDNAKGMTALRTAQAIAAQAASPQFAPFTFTGDGSTTAFDLVGQTGIDAIGADALLLWFEDGIVQRNGTDFTTSGTTVTRGTAPVNGAVIFGFVSK